MPLPFTVGAGTITPDQMTPERELAIRAALEQAVKAGHAVLDEGGSSLDAVTEAIRIMEDAPEFNAGRGAVLTEAGRVEMDAAIMDGATLEAGAVASVTGLRHPIDAARRVMTDSPHVMLMGEGAEVFARQFELEEKPTEWFITDFRRDQLRAIQAEPQASTQLSEDWYSTVGAVAIDRAGNLAAATSTGGMANKRWGRVGDSPDHRRRHLRQQPDLRGFLPPGTASSSFATSLPTISVRGMAYTARTARPDLR